MSSTYRSVCDFENPTRPSMSLLRLTTVPTLKPLERSSNVMGSTPVKYVRPTVPSASPALNDLKKALRNDSLVASPFESCPHTALYSASRPETTSSFVKLSYSSMMT